MLTVLPRSASFAFVHIYCKTVHQRGSLHHNSLGSTVFFLLLQPYLIITSFFRQNDFTRFRPYSRLICDRPGRLNGPKPRFECFWLHFVGCACCPHGVCIGLRLFWVFRVSVIQPIRQLVFVLCLQPVHCSPCGVHSTPDD